MANPVLAMMWGLIFTIQLHIAKAMERHGIEIFDQIRAKLKKDESEKIESELKKPTIYIIGFTLNNLVFLYQWANATTAGEEAVPYFTSMFGIGLIALMIYSRKILKEEIIKMEYIGAAVLIIGTLILGIDGFLNPIQGKLDKITAFIIIGVYGIIAAFSIFIAYKKESKLLVGIIFGFVAGGFGGLDSVLKAMGLGGSALPTEPIGWVIFLSSFASGTIAMLLTQWGFAKKANASVLVPSYNAFYVIFPSLIASFAIPGYLTPLTIIGIVVVIIGIVLNRAFKKETPITQQTEMSN